MKKIYEIVITGLILNSLVTSTHAQNITTIAGTGIIGFSGDSGLATLAKIRNPCGVCIASSGNIYFIDYYNHRIRKIDPLGIISTVAGNGCNGWNGDSIPALSACVDFPSGISVDSLENIYISEFSMQMIRKIDTAGNMITVAGSGAMGFYGDGGNALLASLHYPRDVAADKNGNLFIADDWNGRIRKVDTMGIINTFAGNGMPGFSGDGGPATQAQISAPYGIAIDKFDNVYFSDAGNNRIRKIDSAGIINTIAGNGILGFSGDGGAALSASIYAPHGICVDPTGNIYFADAGNNRIRMVNTSGIINTIAGNGIQGYSGDGGPAVAAALNVPLDVILDHDGNLIIVDQYNHRIRKVELISNTGEINLENNRFLFPNPLTTQSKLTFKNPSKEKFLFTLYDITGRMTESVSTTTDEIVLTKGSKQPGVYLFNLMNEKTGERMNGKIVISN